LEVVSLAVIASFPSRKTDFILVPSIDDDVDDCHGYLFTGSVRIQAFKSMGVTAAGGKHSGMREDLAAMPGRAGTPSTEFQRKARSEVYTVRRRATVCDM
jgi:hypothetical protein